MSNFELLLDIIEIRQRVGSYYIASIKTKDLLEISSVDRMRMEKEGDCRASYLGIQRRLDESRVKKLPNMLKTEIQLFQLQYFLLLRKTVPKL